MKLAAIAAFVLVGLAVGQTIRPIPDTQVRLVGEIPAEWWTNVELRGSNNPPELTYTVPADKYFVVTNGLNAADGVLADGQPVGSVLVGLGNGTRVPFQPGVLLSVPDGHGTARLWGYLEPVR